MGDDKREQHEHSEAATEKVAEGLPKENDQRPTEKPSESS